MQARDVTHIQKSLVLLQIHRRKEAEELHQDGTTIQTKDPCAPGNLRMERKIYKSEMTHTPTGTHIHINISCVSGNSRMKRSKRMTLC